MKFCKQRMAWVRHAAVSSAVACFSAAAQAPEDVRVALVIGNATYPGPAALANPANDAAAMGGTLKTLGFTVHELKDGSREQMQAAVGRVRDALRGKKGIGMLYYAGHGVQVDFRNYMVPVDAQLTSAADVGRAAIDVGDVIEAFKAAGNRMNILVLDACRDNPFPTAKSGKGLAPLDAPSGTFLAYATAPGNVAEDGDAASGNGLYTGFLVKELQKPAAKIEDVFKRVRFQVRQHSKGRQIPWESTSLEDDFYFNDGAKHTFRAEDLAKLAGTARLRQEELDAAAAQMREEQRLKQLSAAQARDEVFRREKADWDRIRDSKDVDQFYAFLQKYPSGNLTEHAQVKVALLQQAQIAVQPEAGGKAQVPFHRRYQEGDRMEFVVKDGLTGLERQRGVIEVRYRDEEAFDGVVVSGNVQGASANRAGFVSRDGAGTYDPPWVVVPGSEYQVGKRVQQRSIRTDNQGRKMWVDVDSRVVAREKIQTAFGLVDTYKVEIHRLFEDGFRQKMTYWFEPEWGYGVRQQVENRRSGNVPDILIRDMVVRSRKG